MINANRLGDGSHSEMIIQNQMPHIHIHFVDHIFVVTKAAARFALEHGQSLGFQSLQEAAKLVSQIYV